MRAGSLVRVGVVKVARFVATEGTQRIEDVVEDVVLADPCIVLLETAGEKVHAVGSAEREVAVLGINEVLAVGRVDVLVGHLDGAAGGGLFGGRVTGVEIVPGIVTDVVGAFGLIDAEEVEGAVLVGEGDADVCAVDRVGPVGDAISVDLASQDAYRRRKGIVGRGPDGSAVALAIAPDRRGGGDERDEQRVDEQRQKTWLQQHDERERE